MTAEYIHREWMLKGPGRKLSIVRPAVIFGKGEGKGQIHAHRPDIEEGYLRLPRPKRHEACVYVKDVCRLLAELATTDRDYCCYNLCYPDKTTIEDICRGFHTALGYGLPRFKIPHPVIIAGAAVLRNVNMPFVRGLGLDPERIAKLVPPEATIFKSRTTGSVNSTNISSRKLVESGFAFQYDLVGAIRDWASECEGGELY